jgi:hypothetical protein
VNLQSAFLTSGAGGTVTWTFTTPFTAPPIVVATGNSSTAVRIVTVSGTTATSVLLTVRDGTGALVSGTGIHAHAHGT